MSVEITGPGGTTSLFGNTVEVSRGAFVVEITSPGPQGPVGPMGVGDMAKSVYDPDDDGKVVSAVSADAAPWSGITGKPAAFPPETHTHTGVYSPVGHDHAGVYATASHNHDLAYAPLGHDHSGVYAASSHNHDLAYATLGHDHSGVYATASHNHDAVYSAIGHDHSGVYATASHSHAIADVTNLQTALNGKADTTHDHDSAYAALNHNHDAAYSPVGHDHSGTYATTGHTHTGVYAAATHSHAISDVTNLQTTLDGKAATTHNHDTAYSPLGHDHSGVYAPASHTHSEYSLTTHDHSGVYSPVGHDHSGVYAPASHSHAISDVTNLQTALDGKASTTHNHDSAYAAASHNHDTVYLSKTNTTEYTPTANYHPATKKYVDDLVSESGGGDMMKSVYDQDNDGKVDAAEAADSVPWSGVTDKPSTYPPEIHNHDSAYAALDHSHTGVYAPADHNHSGTYATADHTHTGVYAAASHDHALDGLSDVTITTPSSGQVLSYDGSGWVNATAGGGSGDVVGPSSAQADGIPVFDGTTGKLLKDSLYRCTDFIRKNVGSGKGYLVGFSGPSSVSGIAPGTDGQVLMADSAQTLGVKWATPSASGGANLWQLLL